MAGLIAAATLVVAPSTASAHYYGGCKGHHCKRHVVRPYRGWLASTRHCETRGLRFPYLADTGNGFFGAYQFTRSSWRAVGGRGEPNHATHTEQDYRAVKLLHLQGRGAWPVCG